MVDLLEVFPVLALALAIVLLPLVRPDSTPERN
jgi:hypothetical protein